MDPSLVELQAELARLGSEVKELRARVERIESAAPAAERVPAIAVAPSDEPLAVADAPAANLAGHLALAGRSLMVIGGAYLLRALSDGGIVSPGIGAAAAALYAVSLLLLADRAAAVGRRASAGFHGVTGVWIAAPLLWEASTRLALIPPSLGALGLAALLGLATAIAWRRDLAAVAWIALFTTLVATIATAFGTLHLLPFALALLAIAAGTEALADRGRWEGLRWPAALALDAAVLHVAAMAARPDGLPDGYAALPPLGVAALAFALPALYLGSLAIRTFVRRLPPSAFGMAQGAFALAIGLGSAARLLALRGVSEAWVGGLAIVLAGACWAVALAHLDRRRDMAFYSSLGLLLVLGGAPLALSEGGLAVGWGVLAVISTAGGALRDRALLRLHGAVLLVAAAGASGALGAAFDGLLGAAAGPWRPMGPPVAVVVAAGAACYALDALRLPDGVTVAMRVPQALVAATLAWLVGGLGARLVAGLAGAPGPHADAAFVATARTAVLAVEAVGLALAQRRPRVHELAWVVAPVLVGGAVKLLIEDFPSGRAASLFPSLALFGAALVAVPRLLRKHA